MKFSIYVTLFAVLMLTGCDRDEVITDVAACELYHDISYPGVWEFHTYEFSGKDIPNHVQFLDEQLGFVSGNSTDFSQAFAWKTVDGGSTWESYPTSFHEKATSFWFQNEGMAYIAVEQQPGGGTRLARTGVGGVDWAVQEYEYLNGDIIDLYFKNEEQGYAVLYANDSIERISLLKTDNAGQSWTEIFYDATLMQSSTKLLSSITDEHIYLVGAGGNIYQLDLEGNLVRNIQGPHTEITQLQVLTDGIFHLIGYDGFWVTQNGGMTWDKKLSGEVSIGSFFDEDAGLVVHNHTHCEHNTSHAHDVLAATTNGGTDWIKGSLTSNLMVDHAASSKVSDQLSVHLFKNRLVFCRR